MCMCMHVFQCVCVCVCVCIASAFMTADDGVAVTSHTVDAVCV
jgi:hypothetical protein